MVGSWDVSKAEIRVHTVQQTSGTMPVHGCTDILNAQIYWMHRSFDFVASASTARPSWARKLLFFYSGPSLMSWWIIKQLQRPGSSRQINQLYTILLIESVSTASTNCSAVDKLQRQIRKNKLVCVQLSWSALWHFNKTTWHIHAFSILHTSNNIQEQIRGVQK